MTISSLAQVLRVHRVLIGVAVALALAGASVFLLLQKPVYSAEASVVVASRYGSSSSELFQGASFAQIAAKNLAEIATSTYVVEPAARQLEVSVANLSGRVAAVVSDGGSVVTLRVSGPSATAAVAAANAVAASLKDSVGAIQPSVSTPVPNVVVTDIQPAVGATYLSPQPASTLVLAAMGGLLVGFTVAVLRATARPTAQRAVELMGSGEAAQSRWAFDVPLRPGRRAAAGSTSASWYEVAILISRWTHDEETSGHVLLIIDKGVDSTEIGRSVAKAIHDIDGWAPALEVSSGPTVALTSRNELRRATWTTPAPESSSGAALAPRQTTLRKAVESARTGSRIRLTVKEVGDDDLWRLLTQDLPSVAIILGMKDEFKLRTAETLMNRLDVVGVPHRLAVLLSR